MHITTACLALGLNALSLLNGVHARPLDPFQDLNTSEDIALGKMDPYKPEGTVDPLRDNTVNNALLNRLIKLQETYNVSAVLNHSNETGLREHDTSNERGHWIIDHKKVTDFVLCEWRKLTHRLVTKENDSDEDVNDEDYSHDYEKLFHGPSLRPFGPDLHPDPEGPWGRFPMKDGSAREADFQRIAETVINGDWNIDQETLHFFKEDEVAKCKQQTETEMSKIGDTLVEMYRARILFSYGATLDRILDSLKKDHPIIDDGKRTSGEGLNGDDVADEDEDADDEDVDDEDVDEDEDDVDDIDNSTLSRRSATPVDPDSADQDGKDLDSKDPDSEDPDSDEEDDSTEEEDAEHQPKNTKLTGDEYESMVNAQNFLLGVDPGQISASQHGTLMGFYADIRTIIMRGHKEYDAEVKDNVGFAREIFKHAPRREGDFLERLTHHTSTVAKRSLGPVPFGSKLQTGEPALTPSQQEKVNAMVTLFMEKYHSENATITHDKRAETQRSGSQATEESANTAHKRSIIAISSPTAKSMRKICKLLFEDDIDALNQCVKNHVQCAEALMNDPEHFKPGCFANFSSLSDKTE